MSRFHLAGAIATAFLGGAISGCDSGGPRSEPGHYRLVSVNGAALPYYSAPSLGGGGVSHGDLVLRANGSFALGIPDHGLGLLVSGRWRVAGSALHLAIPSERPGESDVAIPASIAGDSVVLSTLGVPPLRLVFRRVQRSRLPVTSGTYVLVSMNGRSDLTFVELVHERRYIDRVRFDTITFFDGVFFRRHRDEEQLAVAGGDTIRGGYSFITHGAYDGAGTILVLRDYGEHGALRVRVVDSLTVMPDTLVRRMPAHDRSFGAEYMRQDVYHRRR